MDGDMVVIQRTDQAHNGEIVVALVDGFDVTLKRFRKQGILLLLSLPIATMKPAFLTAIRWLCRGVWSVCCGIIRALCHSIGSSGRSKWRFSAAHQRQVGLHVA